MLAIIGAFFVGVYLLSDFINSDFGFPDLVNFQTLISVALLFIALHLGGVGRRFGT